MADPAGKAAMLLLEPETLLRRTVAMALRERGVGRIILKPFRARALLDTFAEFEAARLLPALPAQPYRSE